MVPCSGKEELGVLDELIEEMAGAFLSSLTFSWTTGSYQHRVLEIQAFSCPVGVRGDNMV